MWLDCNSEHTLLADSGGFWMEDWHMVPLRPELRKLLGVEMVEIPVNCGQRKKDGSMSFHSEHIHIQQI